MSRPTTSPLALNAQESVVWQPVQGFAIFQIISTTVRLGIPDLLANATKTADELAASTGADPDALFRLLRAANAVGLLTMSGEGKFELSELGSMFRSDSPSGAGTSVILNSSAPMWRAWGGLTDAVRTGRPVFDGAYGVGIFEYLERDPELASVFHAAMASGTESQIPQLARYYDFGDAEHIIDIGGGNGTHLAAILNLDKRLRGTVFDTTSGLREAPEVLRRAGVADRCETVVGDFFQAIPISGDVYVIKNVLTDWNDESCVTILRNCRAAMPRHGKVVIVATLMPEDTSTQSADDVLSASIFDISLMVLTTGRERTLTEYERLFTSAGLTLGKVTQIARESASHTTTLYHTIEALPVLL